MRPSQALTLHRDRIRQIALSHHVQAVRVFGSALSGEDVEGSDLDLLVEPTAETTLFDIGAIRFELKRTGAGHRRLDAQLVARQIP
jgi:predicted nucleotidyltransferase